MDQGKEEYVTNIDNIDQTLTYSITEKQRPRPTCTLCLNGSNVDDLNIDTLADESILTNDLVRSLKLKTTPLKSNYGRQVRINLKYLARLMYKSILSKHLHFGMNLSS